MTDVFAKWLIPLNGAELMAIGVAVILAIYYVFSNAEPPSGTERFHQQQRVKALLWILGSGGAALVLDWRGLTFDENVDKGHLIGLYGSWVVLSILLLLVVGTFAFLVEAALLARSDEAFRPHLIELPMTFVVSGWSGHKQAKLDLSKKSEEKAANAAVRSDELATAEILSKLSLRIIRDVIRINDRSKINEAIDEIMKAIKAEVMKYALKPKPEIRINYFVAKDWIKVTNRSKSNTLFAFGDDSSYSHRLILRRRLGDDLGHQIVVPVADHIHHREKLLPGAPECVRLLPYCCLSPEKLTFRPEVPEHICDAVQQYFRQLVDSQGQTWRTVLSIRLRVPDATMACSTSSRRPPI